MKPKNEQHIDIQCAPAENGCLIPRGIDKNQTSYSSDGTKVVKSSVD